jgi:hypothetical protein
MAARTGGLAGLPCGVRSPHARISRQGGEGCSVITTEIRGDSSGCRHGFRRVPCLPLQFFCKSTNRLSHYLARFTSLCGMLMTNLYSARVWAAVATSYVLTFLDFPNDGPKAYVAWAQAELG